MDKSVVFPLSYKLSGEKKPKIPKFVFYIFLAPPRYTPPPRQRIACTADQLTQKSKAKKVKKEK